MSTTPTDTLREAVEREAKQMRATRDYLRGRIRDRGNARVTFDGREANTWDAAAELLDRILAAHPAPAGSDMTCDCQPCPGRGNDGHGLTHCAECCFGTGVIADMDCPVHGEAAVRTAAGWRSPTEVAALVDEREAQVAGEIRRHAEHMEGYSLPAISPGFVDGYQHALKLLHRDADVIAARAATKAVSDA